MEGHRPSLDRAVRGAAISVRLTQVQARFLARHASGLTQAEVAAEEYVSERVVQETLHTARGVLGAGNNVQAALIAHALGYLSDPNEDGVVLAQSPFTSEG